VGGWLWRENQCFRKSACKIGEMPPNGTPQFTDGSTAGIFPQRGEHWQQGREGQLHPVSSGRGGGDSETEALPVTVEQHLSSLFCGKKFVGIGACIIPIALAIASTFATQLF